MKSCVVREFGRSRRRECHRPALVRVHDRIIRDLSFFPRAVTPGSPFMPNCAMNPLITRKNRASSKNPIFAS